MILLRGFNNHTIHNEDEIVYIVSVDTQGDDAVCIHYDIGEGWADVGDVDFRTNTFHIHTKVEMPSATLRVFFAEGARMDIVVPLFSHKLK